MDSSSRRAVAMVPLPTSEGTFEAVFSDAGVCCIGFPGENRWRDRWLRRHVSGARLATHDPRAGRLSEELDAYLDGSLTDFRFPIDLWGTPFQLGVWNALRAIPYGQTRTYGEVARAIGRPDAVRAVGAANGANPVPVIVPCHRVIGSGGDLVGFGGGLDWKRRLLAIECPERWAGELQLALDVPATA